MTPANDASDTDPQPLFNHVVAGLGNRGLAYIHIVEGATGGARDFSRATSRSTMPSSRPPIARPAGRAPGWSTTATTRQLAEKAVADGYADLVAFGKLFIANPDLVSRLKRNAELNDPDKATFYGGDAKGYTDYPTAA